MINTLTIENQKPINNICEQELIAAIERLKPEGGPGFLILDSIGNNYMQCAGGNGEYVLESRIFNNDIFIHYVAGRKSASSHLLKVKTNGYHVKVNNNEVLNKSEVIEIFRHFYEAQVLAPEYAWRDNTEMYKKNPGGNFGKNV